LNDQPYPTRHLPPLFINVGQITSRLGALADSRPCPTCEIPAADAVTDIARLLIQVNQLHIALREERIRSANLEAAIRAALGAYEDGEADPLGYLRDEIAGNTGGAHGA
jgi:hypothetical protein